MTSSSDGPAGEAQALDTRDFEGLLARFQQQLASRLAQWVHQRRQRAAEIAGEGSDLVDCVDILVNAGGKRARPAIAWHAHQAVGGQDEEAAWSLAIACEFLHSYLLIHDDIMDRADQRRGEPTPHVRHAGIHRTSSWHGDPDEHGRAVAIMAGDLAFSWASESASLAILGTDPERGEKLSHLFFGMAEEVIWGQHLEMRAAARHFATDEDLSRILQLKSGLYSVQRPLLLGLDLGGTPPDVRDALARYGCDLGEAFQLQDDLLGIFGDPGEVGKSVGGDLREGKYTFLIHHALRLSPAEEQSVLRARLGQDNLADHEVNETCDIIERCGARDAVREMIEQRMERARSSLAVVVDKLTLEGRAFFEGLVAYLGDRNQ